MSLTGSYQWNGKWDVVMGGSSCSSGPEDIQSCWFFSLPRDPPCRHVSLSPGEKTVNLESSR